MRNGRLDDDVQNAGAFGSLAAEERAAHWRVVKEVFDEERGAAACLYVFFFDDFATLDDDAAAFAILRGACDGKL